MPRFFSFRKIFDRLLRPASGLTVKRRHRQRVRPVLEPLENRMAPAVTFSIATANNIVLGTGGTADMDFTVTRTGDLGSQLTVGYKTVAGSALPNVDFTPVTGTTTFAYGSPTADILIPVFGPNAYNHSNLQFSVQLTGLVSVVGGPVTLAAKTDFGVGTGPVSVAMADLNGDGKANLVVANSGDNTVSVLLNTTTPGATTPSFATPQTFATGTNPVAVTIVDLNGDGQPDLVVADDNSAGTVSVLLNTTRVGAATLSFASHVDFAVGANPASLAIADLNGDGKPDLVVANNGSDNVSVLLNTTAPGATTPTFAGHVDFATGMKPYAVAIADLNGDGKADLAVANGGSNSVSLLLNTTATGAIAPSFAAKQDFTTGTKPVAVALGDLNGDGKPDLVVANAGDNTASVLLNTTTPGSATFSFTAKQDFQTGTSPQFVAIKDLNGDGKPDLVVANNGSDTLSVLLNTTVPGATVPTFATQQTFATGGGPSSVAMTDINGDGEPDLVVADNAAGANSVSVLLNTTVLTEASNQSTFPATAVPYPSATQAVAVGDINGDGKPDLIILPAFGANAFAVLMNTTPPGAATPTFAAPKNFAAGNNPSSLAVADLNGDGKLDVIVTNRADGTISVFFNRTAPGAAIPTFTGQKTFPAGNNERKVVTADLNGDGKPDIIVLNYSGYVSVLMNTTPAGATTPSFAAAQNFPVGAGPFSLAVGDLNGDGKPDIVVGNQNDDTVSVLLNTTAPGALVPTFAAQQKFNVGHSPESVAIGDMNGDGKPDLVVADQNSISIMRNTTTPGATTASFAPDMSLVHVFGIYHVIVGDLNGDGKPDIIVNDYGDGSSWLLLNTTMPGSTTPTFTKLTTAAIGRGSNSVGMGDFSGTGRPGPILTSQGANTLTVFTDPPATIGTGTATATITEFAQFSAATESVNENAGTFSVTVNLSLASPVDTTIPFTVGGTAVSGTNYSGVTPSPLVIPAGQTSGTITGTLLDDGHFDVNKTLTVTLGTPTNAILGSTTATTLTINESDLAPVVALATATQTANENSGTFTIQVNLTGSTLVAASIPFTLGGTALSGTNYTLTTASPLLIPAGQTSATITGALLDDQRFDTANKTLIFSLGTPANATLGATTADTLTINESDAMPTVSFGSATQTVNENAGMLSVAVSLSAASSVPTTIPFTLGGTATSGTNYSGVAASPLVIPAGQTSGTITGTLINDNTYDTVNKTLTFTLGTPTNAALGTTAADTLTINENVPLPAVSFASAAQTVAENASTFSVTVQLSNASTLATTVPFTVGGTAISGTQYSGVTANPLVIPAGQTSGTITGTLIDDGIFEPVNKTLIFTIGAPTNGTLGATQTNTLTIKESTPAPTVAFAAASEALSATAGTFSVTVNLSASSIVDTTIPFSLGGTATAGTDFSNLTASPLVIPAGQTTATIVGTLISNPGLNKTLIFTLSVPINATLGGDTVNTLTIQELNSATSFVVSAPNNATAGAPFIFTVTAINSASQNPITNYSGTVHFTSSDAKAGVPASVTVTGGFGFFLGTLRTAGAQTITAVDTGSPPLTGTSGSVTVGAGPATRLTFSTQPTSATTGVAFPITVTALDAFGNIATGYTGHVHFTSSDARASLPADAALTAGVGSFSVTLNSGGSETITATDTTATNPIIGGTSSPIASRGLTVTAFTPTATDFTASFSKPLVPANLTLYGSGPHTAQDVTLVGAHVGPIAGSLFIDPSNMSVTFKATENSLATFFTAPILPDDTYTVTLVSGASNGFGDALGAGLDGANNGGQANYTTTFTVANAGKPIVSIPDFAQGPDGANKIQIPNDKGHGIPITLANAAAVTDATFTLDYNPALLTISGGTGGAGSDATDPAALFAMVGVPTIIDATHASAVFLFHTGTAASDTLVLGDIQATVPNSAAASYKAKEILHIGAIVLNGSTTPILTAVAADGLHVNAYFGDVTGNGTIDALDVATANTVAQGASTGFNAYTLLDPAIIGDVANDISVDAGDVSTLAAYVSGLPTPVIPTLPSGVTITPVGPDPTLSLNGGRVDNGVLNVSVLLDHPHPAGSSGMIEAILALRYDPSALSVSAADISLGTVPGAGWQLSAVVDAARGQIGIEIFGAQPITATQAGSLVNITFHVRPGVVLSPTTVQLADEVSPNGQRFVTQVDDEVGQYVLSRGLESLTVPIGGHNAVHRGRGCARHGGRP
jgi:hypothetical protein